MNENNPSNLESINEVYQQRVDGLEAANKIKTDEAEKAREDSGIVSVDTPFPESAEDEGFEEDEEEPVPNKSWKKDRLVDYILEINEDVSREELEELTKAELLDRFTAHEG